jgi:hypothetical protein
LLTICRRTKISRERDRYLVGAVQKIATALNTIEGVDIDLEDLDLLNADCLSDGDPEEVDDAEDEHEDGD